MGNALVTVKNSKAYLKVVNTNEEDYEIFVPTIKVCEFEEGKDQIQSINPNLNENSGSNTDSCCPKRYNRKEKIIELLRLIHLNSEERKRREIDRKNVEHTEIIQYRILTNDEVPINTKQYPLIQKYIKPK